MDKSRLFPLSCVCALVACFEPPEADLVGPTVEAASLVGPRSVELSVMPELVVEFSEPIDPASIHAGSVALVVWEELESCALSPICAEGSCERGTCQGSPLTTSERSAIDRGEFADGIALVYVLGEGPAGPDSRLSIRPRRPLASHRRHSLIVGAAVRDRSGAPLVDDNGAIAGWQRDFVTADQGSGGPEPRLVAPAHGQARVPTNVAAIDTSFWPPIPEPAPGANLWLEPQQPGAIIELVDPVVCPGWVPGTCLRWRPAQALAPDSQYRPAGGSLVDRHGRPALLPAAERETWFTVGPGPDLQAPEPSTSAQMRGRCLALWVEVGEAVEVLLRAGEHEQRASIDGAGWIGLAITDALEPDHSVAWSLELRDFANNHAVVDGELSAGLGFAAELPQLRLTEVLANPSGPEPHAEFVELRAGPAGAALSGVHLADASLAQVRDAWASGDVLGDPLPAIELAPNEIAIIVASGHASESSDDPQPPPATKRLVVDASIGTGGLKNVGERLILWAETEHGPALISSYGNWIDTSATKHEGRSVVAGHDGCDLPNRWRSHPLGRSTPGSLP